MIAVLVLLAVMLAFVVWACVHVAAGDRDFHDQAASDAWIRVLHAEAPHEFVEVPRIATRPYLVGVARCARCSWSSPTGPVPGAEISAVALSLLREHHASAHPPVLT